MRRNVGIGETVATALLGVVLAVGVVAVARLLDVPVLVPDLAGGAHPLQLGTVVLVIAVAVAATSATGSVVGRIAPGRRGPVVRSLGWLAIGLSLLPVVVSGRLTTANQVTLALVHVLVGSVVLRRLGRAA